jgi:hypothetical protein
MGRKLHARSFANHRVHDLQQVAHVTFSLIISHHRGDLAEILDQLVEFGSIYIGPGKAQLCCNVLASLCKS